MRVAVDATAIPGRRAGAGTYVTELLRAMDDVDLGVFINSRDMDDFAQLIPRARLFGIGFRSRPMRIAWARFVLPRLVRGLKPDVFHGPHYTLPSRLPCPSVVTFHDPTFFTMPELHERAKVAYFTRAARSAISRATRVIAVSEYARRGAIEHAGADPDRTEVVFEGADLRRYKPGPVEVAKPYILFVGTLEPRKDVPTLIDAYAKLDTEHELVLVGQDGWGTDAIDRAIAASGKPVRRTGYITEEEKINLYRGASIFVYPSIAEGFGLPVLEAMSCGKAVITTTGSAPEEIAGDAALLVPPRDTDGLRAAMARLLSDEALRSDLASRAPARALPFTWKRAAAETVAVYAKATR